MRMTSMKTKGGMRAGVAVTAALIAASDLAAQRPASTRGRDSVVVRVVGTGLSGDSLRVLIQQFDREAAGTQRWLILKGRIDSLVGMPDGIANATNAFVHSMVARAEASRSLAESRRGWLGFSTQGPARREYLGNGDLLVTQLAYPTIVTVDPQSPAEKAGIVAGDVLVAYNGVDVVNHEFSMNALQKPDTKVTVTVRRDGEPKEYQLIVARAPQRVSDQRWALERPVTAAAAGMDAPESMRRGRIIALPRDGEPLVGAIVTGSPLVYFTGSGVLGASVSTVNVELAKTLNLRAGVLVNDVPQDSPAYRAGLRTGDVITAVGDQPVVSIPELRAMLMRTGSRAVALQVAHNQKTRTVNLVPSP